MTRTCFVCRRTQPVEKMDGNRCANVSACHRYALDHLLAKKLTKRAEKVLKFGEEAGLTKKQRHARRAA